MGKAHSMMHSNAFTLAFTLKVVGAVLATLLIASLVVSPVYAQGYGSGGGSTSYGSSMNSYGWWYGGGSATSETFTGSANLNGTSEVPSVSTSASGNLTLNGSHTEGLQFMLNAYNIQNVTAAHLHCAASGQNGPVVVSLWEGGPMNSNGALSAGTINNSHIIAAPGCATPVSTVENLIQAIQNGHIYVNVHTTGNPNGEIRRQVSGSGSGGGHYGGNSECRWDGEKWCDCDMSNKDDQSSKDWDHAYNWNKYDDWEADNWNGKDGKDGRDGKDGYDGMNANNDWETVTKDDDNKRSGWWGSHGFNGSSYSSASSIVSVNANNAISVHVGRGR